MTVEPLRLKAPEAKALFNLACELIEQSFGSGAFPSPRLPEVKEGKGEEVFSEGLVCGAYRGQTALGAVWVRRGESEECGVVVSPTGVVLGLYVRFGKRWVRRGRGIEGRRLEGALEALPKMALPSGLKGAFLRGLRLLPEVLGPNFELLSQRMDNLFRYGIEATLFTRPFPAREDFPFEAELTPGKGAPASAFSIEVGGEKGRVAKPSLLCLTPWGSLLWRGRLEFGLWAVAVAGPGGRRYLLPFWVFPPQVREAVLIVKGMRSILDASKVKRALRAVPGVGRVEVELKEGKVKVWAFSGAILPLKELRSRLEQLGYKVEEVRKK